jgi:hypothetical protein
MKYIAHHSIGVLIAVATLVLAAGLPIYFYLRIQSARAYVEEVAGEIAQQSHAEQTLALTRQTLTDTERDRAKLDALALPSDGAADFINMVEQQAKRAGVSLEVGNVNATPKEGMFDSLGLAIKATGSFAATTRFLHLLETLPYASSVTSVVIGTGGEKAGMWVFTGALTVPIHKQP